MNDEIDFTAPEENLGGIDFNQANPVPLSKEVIDGRAFKNNIALGSASPGLPALKDQIARGDEDSTRDLAVSSEFLKDRQARFDLVQEYVAKGGQLNNVELDMMLNFGNDPQAADKQTVLEKSFSENMLDFFMANEDPEEAAKATPESRNIAYDVAREYVTKSQIVQRSLEDIEAVSQDRNLVQRGLDIADTFAPFWSWYNLQNKTGKDLGGFLRGENLQAQFQNLWTLPPSEFAQQYNQVIRELNLVNPEIARQFAQGMQSYTSAQQTMDNIWSGVEVASLVPAAKIAGAIGKFVKGGKITQSFRATAQVVDGAGEYVSDAERLKNGWKIVTEDEGERVLTDKELVDKGWSIQSADGPATDGERLLSGWDVGEVDFPRGSTGSQYEQARQIVTNQQNASTSFLQRQLKIGYAEAEKLIGQLEKNGVVSAADKSGKRTILKPSYSSTTKTTINGETTVVHNQNFRAPVQAMVERNRKPEEVIDAMGLSEEAMDMGALTRATKESELVEAIRTPQDAIKLDPELKAHNFDVMIRQIPSLSNPNRVLDDVGNLAAEGERRLYALLKKNIELAQDALNNPFRVLRGTQEAVDFGLNDAKAAISRIYNRPVDAIIDFRDVRPEETLDGVGYVEASIGTKNGSLFKTRRQAVAYAKNYLGLADTHKIVPQGNGYVVRVRKAIDETTSDYREALLKGDGQVQPNSLTKFLFGFGSGKDQFSPFIQQQRAAAVAGSQRLASTMRELARPLENLTKAERKSLTRIMEQNRDAIDPKNAMKRGEFFKDSASLDKAYLSTFKRVPSQAETEAYFTAVQLNDLEWLFRNIEISAWKQSRGFGKVTVSSSKASVGFEGKFVDALPWSGADDFTVVLFDGAKQRIYRKSRMFPGEQKKLEEMLATKGYRTVQTFDPYDEALRKAANTNTPINFVISKQMGFGDLDWQQVSYRPGGHSQIKSPLFAKQARVSNRGDVYDYNGDTTAMGFENTAKGQKFVKALEEARRLLNANDDAALKAHLEKNLPQEWDLATFKAKFDDTLDEAGKVIKRAQFQKNTPFVLTKTGQNTLSSGVAHNGRGMAEMFPGLRNPADDPLNSYAQLDKRFLGERDTVLDAIREGGEGQPAYSLGVSEQIDPMTMIQNSLGSMIRSRYFTDLQTVSAESFVQEFADVLLDKTGAAYSREALRRNPIAALADAQIDKSNSVRGRQAETIRRATLDLLGRPSEYDQDIGRWKEALKAQIYNTLGPNSKPEEWLSNAEIPTITDGLRYLKAVGFHTKLGLFNPVQVFVQAQTLANISLIAGKNGVIGTRAATAMRMLDLTANENVIAKVANTVTKLSGMSGDNFIESYKWMKQTGFDVVGQDYAWRGDIFEDKLFQGTAAKFLDKGTIFFNETERYVRMSSWNTAYLEYVAANPKLAGKIDVRDAQKILSRAGDLSGNMTKDANAFWQERGFAPFTQFLSYQARMIDLMVGKRLTGKEKARLMMGWGALYGVGAPLAVVNPLGLSFGTDVPTNYEDIRQGMLERGVDPNSGILGYVMNGIPAMVAYHLTGEQPNFGERYGLQSYQIFPQMQKEFADDDTTFENLLSAITIGGGASGSISSDIISDGTPMLKSAYGWLNGDNSVGVFMADVERVSKNVSSINNASRLWMGLYGGKFISKNGTLTTDNLSPGQALFYSVTGTTPQEVSDGFRMLDSIKDWKSHEKAVQKEATRLTKLWAEARDAGREDDVRSYDTQLRALYNSAGLSESQKRQIMRNALSEDTFTKSIVKSWLKNGDPEQLRARQRMILERDAQ